MLDTKTLRRQKTTFFSRSHLHKFSSGVGVHRRRRSIGRDRFLWLLKKQTQVECIRWWLRYTRTMRSVMRAIVINRTGIVIRPYIIERPIEGSWWVRVTNDSTDATTIISDVVLYIKTLWIWAGASRTSIAELAVNYSMREVWFVFQKYSKKNFIWWTAHPNLRRTFLGSNKHTG